MTPLSSGSRVSRDGMKIDRLPWSTWLTFLSKWEQKQGHIREDEPLKFDFLSEEGNSSRRKGINASRAKVDFRDNDIIQVSASQSLSWEWSSIMICAASWWKGDVSISSSSEGFRDKSGIEAESWRPKMWRRCESRILLPKWLDQRNKQLQVLSCLPRVTWDKDGWRVDNTTKKSHFSTC